MTHFLGVDTGGTFTDFVAISDQQWITHKVLSTPDAPEKAILQGISDLGLDSALQAGTLLIVHGTTVATNATLEGKGAKTLFITNEGLEDTLLIGRQTRPELYQLRPTPQQNPLDPALMLGIHCRLDNQGLEVQPLEEDSLAELLEQVDQLQPEAIAISLIFSYLNPDHERRLTDALANKACLVCHSSEVLPIAGEYERGVATWLNAWLGPVTARYIERLHQTVAPCPLTIMQSHGGTLSASRATVRPVDLLLSGPAGGLCAARDIGREENLDRLLTFDMGGTSTDVALIDADFNLTLEGKIGHWPVAVPMVDMHTIGAGGGSLAYTDDGGLLHVGPASAGADPGPACYGRGGQQLTVTDANLLLGRLPARLSLGGTLELDREAALAAASRLVQQLDVDEVTAAQGVIALANEHMAQALRVISIQRGHDPTDFVLVCFGGAGGLHVCALAEQLGMNQAMVPARSGVLSAQGLVSAPRQSERIQAVPDSDNNSLCRLFRQLLKDAEQQLRDEGIKGPLESRSHLDLCYLGQSFTLSVPWQGELEQAEESFHQCHEQRYGHRLSMKVTPVNARVQLRSSVRLPRPPKVPTQQGAAIDQLNVQGEQDKVPLYRRDKLGADQCLQGPAIIADQGATTWLASGWQARLTDQGHLMLDRLSPSGRLNSQAMAPKDC